MFRLSIYSFLFLTFALGAQASGQAADSLQPPTPSPTEPSTTETVKATKQKTPLTTGDSQFMFEALNGSRKEIAAGKAALKNSSDPKVKSFAEKLLTDHKAAVANLRKIAKKGGTLTAKGKETGINTQLSTLRGSEFDKEFAKQMVSDHEAAIKLFEDSQKSIANPQLQEFASSTLPTLREHLKEAQELSR